MVFYGLTITPVRTNTASILSSPRRCKYRALSFGHVLPGFLHLSPGEGMETFVQNLQSNCHLQNNGDPD